MATQSVMQPIKVNCVSDADLQSLIDCINRWQAEEFNLHTNLDHENSDWTGRYYSGFLRGKPSAWRFATTLQYLTTPAPTVGTAVQVLNLKETRDLVARVHFVYYGSISRTDAGQMLPNGMMYRPESGTSMQMTSELIKVGSDGMSAIITRTFHWVMWKIKTPAFMALNRANESKRQAFWFAGLNRITVVWLLKYIRDALDFEWLVEAADLHASVPGRYTAADTQRAKYVLHMLKLRLVHAADAVFLYMIDIKPYEDMRFLVRDDGLSSAAKYWRQGVESFKRTEPYHVPLEDWPMRVELQYRKKRNVVAGPSDTGAELAGT